MNSAIITFQSNSAARKTFETLRKKYEGQLQIYWMNMDGLITGKANVDVIGEDKEALINSMLKNQSLTGEKV